MAKITMRHMILLSFLAATFAGAVGSPGASKVADDHDMRSESERDLKAKNDDNKRKKHHNHEKRKSPEKVDPQEETNDGVQKDDAANKFGKKFGKTSKPAPDSEMAGKDAPAAADRFGKTLDRIKGGSDDAEAESATQDMRERKGIDELGLEVEDRFADAVEKTQKRRHRKKGNGGIKKKGADEGVEEKSPKKAAEKAAGKARFGHGSTKGDKHDHHHHRHEKQGKKKDHNDAHSKGGKSGKSKSGKSASSAGRSGGGKDDDDDWWNHDDKDDEEEEEADDDRRWGDRGWEGKSGKASSGDRKEDRWDGGWGRPTTNPTLLSPTFGPTLETYSPTYFPTVQPTISPTQEPDGDTPQPTGGSPSPTSTPGPPGPTGRPTRVPTRMPTQQQCTGQRKNKCRRRVCSSAPNAVEFCAGLSCSAEDFPCAECRGGECRATSQ